MIYLNAFIFSGLVCLVAEIILDNTNLSAGHITSIFTVIGGFLSFLGIYDFLIKYFGSGATVLITNFGNVLYKSALSGYYKNGLIGIFEYMLLDSSLVLTVAIIISFFLAIIFKPKD